MSGPASGKSLTGIVVCSCKGNIMLFSMELLSLLFNSVIRKWESLLKLSIITSFCVRRNEIKSIDLIIIQRPVVFHPWFYFLLLLCARNLACC